jgi:uncharacterized Zn-binding protein involved in type VI secretion
MPALSRKTDKNSAGGKIMKGAGSVFSNGLPVGLHAPSPMTPHEPFGKPHPPHSAAKTTSGSPSVFAEGYPVLRIGSGNTCGHPIIQGSPNVFVP